eukprot:COSAG06_NODE_2260_length_7213_cov_19.735732_6_plen_178_part_00
MLHRLHRCLLLHSHRISHCPPRRRLLALGNLLVEMSQWRQRWVARWVAVATQHDHQRLRGACGGQTEIDQGDQGEATQLRRNTKTCPFHLERCEKEKRSVCQGRPRDRHTRNDGKRPFFPSQEASGRQLIYKNHATATAEAEADGVEGGGNCGLGWGAGERGCFASADSERAKFSLH